jgi:glyoxylase-like metal-dependent hydrolase (beta-lactamase superfamily II)
MSLERHDVAHVRADNPGPYSLSGTNTWLVGRDPCWIVDPGPLLDAHVDAVLAEAERRGGAGGIALTHHHHDHTEAVPAVVERTGARVVHGEDGGPLVAVPTPGHTSDHVAYVAGRVAFTGDAVLGEGSVFVTTQLSEYLDALRGLRDRDLELICPGHGPLVTDPSAKLDEYVAHRLDRERRLVAALDKGLRTIDELLDEVWDDAPEVLRAAATVTLGAHLEKLAAEGRLPDGVERPELPDWVRAGKSRAF